jgi:uncharacterized protein (TIGR02996 family)
VDERRALVAAIIANPDEDTPRLAFADWLQEHGDTHDRARAEFIRLQIRVARKNSPENEIEKLAERAATLHNTHARHWLGPLWELTAMIRDREFKRGLLDWWHTTAGNFLKKPHQQVVCEWFPQLGIDRLALSENSKRVRAVADSPALAWVSAFQWFDSRIEDDGFEALATAPHTERLSKFLIDKPRCSDTGLKAFAKSTGYPNLRSFGLHDGLWRGKFTDAGIRLILNSRNFPHLNELILSGAHTYSVASRSLFECEALNRLRSLRIGAGSDLKHLVTCAHLTALETLHVYDSVLRDDDARLFIDNPAFARLRAVALDDINSYHSPLGNKAERALRDRFGDGLKLKYSILCRRE